jgi:hypothetical protein
VGTSACLVCGNSAQRLCAPFNYGLHSICYIESDDAIIVIDESERM